jgi:hypothetical protein
MSIIRLAGVEALTVPALGHEPSGVRHENLAGLAAATTRDPGQCP